MNNFQIEYHTNELHVFLKYLPQQRKELNIIPKLNTDPG
jgi:hypothetical protein